MRCVSVKVKLKCKIVSVPQNSTAFNQRDAGSTLNTVEVDFVRSPFP